MTLRPTRAAAGLALIALISGCSATSTTGLLPVEKGAATTYTYATGHEALPQSTEDLERVARILEGRWTGDGFGGTVEETWNPVLGDRAIGSFRLVKDGALSFSEHIALSLENDRVVMRLKHFDPELTSWEERDETVAFPLVTAIDSIAWFEGLTYHRVDNRLEVYLAMKTASGMREEKLVLSREAL